MRLGVGKLYVRKAIEAPLIAPDASEPCSEFAAKTKGNRVYYLRLETTSDHVARLHALGLRDADIARAVGISRQRVFMVRQELGLPSNRPEAAITHTEVIKLHEDGLSDAAMAKKLGISRKAIRRLREACRLPANRSCLTKRNAVQRLFKEGEHNRRRLATKVGCSYQTVQAALKALGVAPSSFRSVRPAEFACRGCGVVKAASEYQPKSRICRRCQMDRTKKREEMQFAQDLAHPYRKRQCVKCGRMRHAKEFHRGKNSCRRCYLKYLRARYRQKIKERRRLAKA